MQECEDMCMCVWRRGTFIERAKIVGSRGGMDLADAVNTLTRSVVLFWEVRPFYESFDSA
jgi:hypothetical protein